MADPVTIASMGLAVGGGITSMLGAGQQASASAASFNYRAGVAQRNAAINRQNADWALQAGETRATESGMKSRQDIGTTRAVQAASGIDVNSGSAARVRDSQVDVANFEQDVIRWDAKKTAYGYQTKAQADEAEAAFDTTAAENAERAGRINMLSAFLNAGGTVASRWLQGTRAGNIPSSAEA